MLVLWASVAKLAGESQRSRCCCDSSVPTMKVRKMVKLTYPDEALREGIRGTVIVELLIDKQGAPKDLRAMKGNPILAGAVLGAVQQWRWQPYRVNREAVEIELTIAVNFEPATETVPFPEQAAALSS